MGNNSDVYACRAKPEDCAREIGALQATAQSHSEQIKALFAKFEIVNERVDAKLTRLDDKMTNLAAGISDIRETMAAAQIGTQPPSVAKIGGISVGVGTVLLGVVEAIKAIWTR